LLLSSVRIILTFYLTAILFCHIYTNAGVHSFSRNAEPPQNFGHLNFTYSRIHTEDIQIIGATVKNVAATATSYLRFVHPFTTECRHPFILRFCFPTYPHT